MPKKGALLKCITTISHQASLQLPLKRLSLIYVAEVNEEVTHWLLFVALGLFQLNSTALLPEQLYQLRFVRRLAFS